MIKIDPSKCNKDYICIDECAYGFIFTHGKLSGGSGLTNKYAIKHGKPWLHVNLSEMTTQEAVQEPVAFNQSNNIEVLNVAGRSAAKDRKI